MSSTSKLSAYINHALNRSGAKLNKKVTGSRRSVIADVHDGLRIILGPDFAERIESKLSDPVSFRGSEEQKALIEVLKSVLAEPLRGSRIQRIGDRDFAADDSIGAIVGLVESLQSAIDKLDPLDRALVWGLHAESKSYRQLSTELGVPRSTLKDRATKLMQNLTETLTDEMNE